MENSAWAPALPLTFLGVYIAARRAEKPVTEEGL